METIDKKRQQITDILDISISPARCSTYLKQYLLNKDVEKLIKEKRSMIKNNNVVGDQLVVIKREISELSQKIIRISSETSTIVAIICNGFIEDILKHGINESINNKKIVDLNNIMSGDHKNNTYYSIYNKLPSFINYNQKEYDETRREKMELNKNKKKTAKKDSTVTDTVVTDTVVTDTVVTDTEDTNAVNEENKTTFNTYIDAVLKNIKKDPKYENIKIRISSEVRDYLSNMIIECIKRFVTLSKIIIQQIMGVRTMNSNHIKAIIHMFMKDEGHSDDKINLIIDNFDNKLKVYQNYIKLDKTNKFNELSEESKKLIEEKRNERLKNKKQNDINNAKKQIQAAEEKVKMLTTEA
jgi:hypothetical protein